MNQTALSDDRVMFPPDLLQFQRVLPGGPTIPVEPMSTFCGDSRRSLNVHSPANVTVEGWHCDDHFARAVVRLINDSTRLVIGYMWQDATGGMWDSRHARQNPAPVLLPSGHGATDVLSPSQDATDSMYTDHQHSAAEWAHAAQRVERLTEILVNLGLSIQTLAEVLQVSRPQLYKWLDAEKLISLQKDSVRRLDEVEWLAKSWRTLSVAPLGPWVRERIDGDRSLLDILTVEPLPTAEIERTLSRIAARITQAPKSKSARLREAGFTRRASHRSLPSDE